jgi:hypothetical protein
MDINVSQDMIGDFMADSGYPHIEGEQDIKRGLEAALKLVSDCRACPQDCAECSKDETCCECYTHQEMHPQMRGQEALSAILDQARRGVVTEAYVRRAVKHFGFEVR